MDGRIDDSRYDSRAAVTRSLARGSALLRSMRDQERPEGSAEWLAAGPGMTDLRSRRTLVAFDVTAFLALVEPEAPAELLGQFDERDGQALFAGGSQYRFAGGRWKRWGLPAAHRRRRSDDPTWLLDVLSAAPALADAGADVVAEVPSRHLRGVVTLRRRDRRPRSGLFSHHRARSIEVHMWISEADGTIVRMSWAARRAAARHGSWHVTELHDYGADVSRLQQLLPAG